MRSPTPAMPIDDAQREVLDRLARSMTAKHREVQRARALLLAGDGEPNTAIGAAVGVSPTTVKAWRERSQPSLPMKRGRAGTMTSDYKRNGTTTLFAALDVLTGEVIGRCLPRHRHEEFLRFLRTIDREVPKGLQVHLILDNYSTHKHQNVNVAGQAPALSSALHADLKLVGQPRRAVLR